MGRAAEPAASVENDPYATSATILAVALRTVSRERLPYLSQTLAEAGNPCGGVNSVGSASFAILLIEHHVGAAI